MKAPVYLTRALTLTVIAIGLLAFSACSPEEDLVWQNVLSSQSQIHTVARSTNAPSDQQLARLRSCESGGNYAAVNSSGSYRGAYQFSRSTWSNVARRVLPDYVGVDPAAAPAPVQDAMARALWSMTGSRSWPVCGRHP